MREKLLTNDQMAEAYGGYDFKTSEMKAVCRKQRELDLTLIRSEIERAGEVGIDPHNYTNPTAIRIGIAMQQAHILKIFEKEDN